MAPEQRSRVEFLARSARRLALIMLAAFIISAGSAISWVNDEIVDPPLWRYATAIADGGAFLAGAVIAWIGGAIIETLGRVRASLLDAIEGQQAESEPARDEPIDW